MTTVSYQELSGWRTDQNYPRHQLQLQPFLFTILALSLFLVARKLWLVIFGFCHILCRMNFVTVGEDCGWESGGSGCLLTPMWQRSEQRLHVTTFTNIYVLLQRTCCKIWPRNQNSSETGARFNIWELFWQRFPAVRNQDVILVNQSVIFCFVNVSDQRCSSLNNLGGV